MGEKKKKTQNTKGENFLDFKKILIIREKKIFSFPFPFCSLCCDALFDDHALCCPVPLI